MLFIFTIKTINLTVIWLHFVISNHCYGSTVIIIILTRRYRQGTACFAFINYPAIFSQVYQHTCVLQVCVFRLSWCSFHRFLVNFSFSLKLKACNFSYGLIFYTAQYITPFSYSKNVISKACFLLSCFSDVVHNSHPQKRTGTTIILKYFNFVS